MIPNQLPGLEFDLGETVDMPRDSVMTFTADGIAPRAALIDESNEVPPDRWRKFGDSDPTSGRGGRGHGGGGDCRRHLVCLPRQVVPLWHCTGAPDRGTGGGIA